MSDYCELFMKILKAELEDLTQDIKLIELKYEEKFKKLEITNYVYQENESFLIHEYDSLEKIKLFIQTVNPISYNSLEELKKELIKKVKDIIKEHDYPKALELLFIRKIEKVNSYIVTHGS